MLGERLAELRKEQKMAQKVLADMLQVTADTVSRYERDLIQPSDETKILICRIFNVSMDYLVGLTEVRTPYSPVSFSNPGGSGNAEVRYGAEYSVLLDNLQSFLIFEKTNDDLTKEMIRLWSLLSKKRQEQLVSELKEEVEGDE